MTELLNTIARETGREAFETGASRTEALSLAQSAVEALSELLEDFDHYTDLFATEHPC